MLLGLQLLNRLIQILIESELLIRLTTILPEVEQRACVSLDRRGRLRLLLV